MVIICEAEEDLVGQIYKDYENKILKVYSYSFIIQKQVPCMWICHVLLIQ